MSNSEKIDQLLEKADLFNEATYFKEAIGCFKEIIEIDPQCAAAWSQMGVVYGEIENYRKAIE